MSNTHRVVLLLILLGSCISLGAQTLPRIDFLRPVYVIAGFPVNESLTKDNFDIKFQYSFALPLVDDIAGSGVSIALGYTQISLWNFFQYSHPFYEHNFKPGIYVKKEWETSDGTSILTSGIEHHSNGRADEYSRSLNYALFSYFRTYDSGLTLKANVRAVLGKYGDVYTVDMPLRYTGFVSFGADYEPSGFPLGVQLDVTPLYNKSIANVTAGLTCRLARNPLVPQLYLQFHYGYDDALRDCLNANGPILNQDGTIPYIAGEPVAPRTYLRAGVRFRMREYVY